MADPRARRADLALLLATGALHLLFENVLRAKGPFLAVAAVVWTVWLARRLRREPGLLRAWGLGTMDLGPALLAGVVVTIPSVAVLWVVGTALGNLPPPHGFWTVLAVYPAWALVQQVALNGILVRGLETLVPRLAVAPSAAVLFSLAHAPDFRLMLLTLAGGLIWTTLYLRWPNIWGIVPCHAVLGTVAYYGILGRDPWRELLVPLAAHLSLLG